MIPTIIAGVVLGLLLIWIWRKRHDEDLTMVPPELTVPVQRTPVSDPARIEEPTAVVAANQQMPAWIPNGEPYRGQIDGHPFEADSEDGFYLRVAVPLGEPLPVQVEIDLKKQDPAKMLDERLVKPVEELAQQGVMCIDISYYLPPCVAAEIPLDAAMPLSKVETIASLLLDLEHEAKKLRV